MTTMTVEDSLQEIKEQLIQLNTRVDYLSERARVDQNRWETVEDLAADLKLVGQSAFEGAVEELSDLDPAVSLEDSLRLLRRLAENTGNLEWTLQQLESIRDFMRDAAPIATYAFEAATDQFEELDRMGVFSFGQEAWRIIQIILTSFTPEDVRALGDNVVLILNTVKGMTQPEVMHMLGNLTGAYRQAGAASDELKTGTFALLKQMRDPEVRRGLAVTMQMLKGVAGGPANDAGENERIEPTPDVE